MGWADGERCLCSPQSLVVSLLLSFVCTHVFSRTEGVRSHQTLRYAGSLDFHQGTCAPSSCSLCSLSSTLQRTQLSVRFLSLGLAESRTLPAAPVDTRPKTSLISFCAVQLRTFCAAHSLANLCLSMISSPHPGKLPGFWGSMVSRHAPIPRKGSGNQQQQQQDFQYFLTGVL